MLELLLRRAGMVVTREELAQAALGRPLSAFDRSVDVHVSRLRKKLGCVPRSGEERIRPVRGIGYFYAAAGQGGPVKSRLFWKIFLPFWILQTCIMLFLAYRVHASFGPDRPWWVQPERRAMPVLARYATWRYSKSGQEGLRELLHDIALDQRSAYWLFDGNMNELSGLPMPADAHAAHSARAPERGHRHQPPAAHSSPNRPPTTKATILSLPASSSLRRCCTPCRAACCS